MKRTETEIVNLISGYHKRAQYVSLGCVCAPREFYFSFLRGNVIEYSVMKDIMLSHPSKGTNT